MKNDNFYSRLPIYKDLNCIADVDRFTDFPEDWLIVVADITNSTEAVKNNLYREVNTVGASVITAVLNVSGDTVIPYVFGGDGATLCIPPELKLATINALVEVQKMSEHNFGLTLRTGMMLVSEITKNGHKLRVARCRMSDYLVSAMFIGDGLEEAEKFIKSGNKSIDMTPSKMDVKTQDLFDGLECRWERIPSRHGETVTLIVKTCDEDEYENAITYAEVIRKIQEIYGTDDKHHPLHKAGLNLSSSYNKLKQEHAIQTFNDMRSGKIKYWLKIITQFIYVKISYFTSLFNVGFDMRGYKEELINNSDYKKFDGMLRMVISGNAEQQHELREYLMSLEENKKLHFGIHSSDSAQITCLIFNHQHEHIHFVDGADGGYTLAATELKKKLLT